MKWFWLINLGLFQASWLSAAFLTQYASLIIILLLALHFYLSPSPKQDLKLLPLALLGFAIDTMHVYLGTFTSQLVTIPKALPPFWLLLLWAMFSLSLHHSLKWFAHQALWLLAWVGAMAGTLSYWGGIQAGALTTELPSVPLVLRLALTWGLLFPLLIILYKQILPARIQQER